MKIAHILGATAALVIVAGCADYGVGNGGFYYRNSANDHYRPAGGSHFRHDAAPGYNHVHGTAHASPRGGDHHPG